MKLGWGWKIGILYGVFVAGISVLVIKANNQSFDLVSKNYYDAELVYQKTIDAGKNQAALSEPLAVHADGTKVTIDFPAEFKDKQITGSVQFYSPVNSEWDQNFKLEPQNNSAVVSRDHLRNTRYTVKISCTVDGKSYYQESDIYLHS